MDYSRDSHSYKPSRAKHDSFLSPSSRDVYGYSRHSRSSTRLDVPTEHPISRNKSVDERERRPYYPDSENRSRSSVRREETYPSFSTRAKSVRRRRSWPPAPSVEDEDEALKKEFPRRRSPKSSDDEVSMPGTVDQNPVLIELENRDRRYVVVPDDEGKRREKHRSSRRGSERAPQLKVDTEQPDLSRRQPTPYSYSKSKEAPSRPDDTGTRRPDLKSYHSSSSSSAYKSSRTTTQASSSDERQTDDSDLEAVAVSKLRERKAKPRVSFTEPCPSPRVRPEIKRFNSDFTSPTESRSRTSTSSATPLKSAMKQPTSAPPSDDEGSMRRKEQTATSAPRSTAVPVTIPSHIRNENGYGAKPTLDELRDSERAQQSRSTYPQPASARSGERPLSGDYSNGRTSQPSSRPNSRPSSPSGTDFDSRDFADALRANASRNTGKGYGTSVDWQPPPPPRSAPHSRTSSYDGGSKRREDVPITPSVVLPYPVDDSMSLMPNHEHYIETPIRETMPPQPKLPDYGAKEFTSSPMASPNLSRDDKFRPRSRHNSSSTSKRPEIPSVQTAKASTVLPPCPRMEYSRGYNDWFTLRGDTSVDICPTCFEGIIRPTPFRLEFARAPPRSPTVNTRCDFGSPWYRVAWLLTQKRKRQDLDLIYALSAISSIDTSCPGARESAGPWYGLLGADGKFIPGYTACSRDFKYIEAMFPSLIGLYHRMPSSTSGRDVRLCSMRLPSERFGDYLNMLEKIDEEARTAPLTSAPTLQSLIKFIRSGADRAPAVVPTQSTKSAASSCTKDTLLLDTTWHFIPLLPEFTVCEDCFDEIIWPSVKQNSDLAQHFHQVLTPLPAGVRMDGASCQLYSPRMRRVWARAIKEDEKDGMKLLARKVRERREVEDDLRQEQKEIEKKLERNKKNSGPLAEDIRASCKRKLDGIAREWADWE